MEKTNSTAGRYGRFSNLQAELRRHQITYKQLTENLAMTEPTLSNKINGHSEFRLSEIVDITNYLEGVSGETYDMDKYLFHPEKRPG